MASPIQTIAFIFARGGSKGLIRKNLLMLGDRPLVAWSIKIAEACPFVRRVIVSTEDVEIARVAREWGAETPFMRPAELATDDAPEWRSYQHALRTMASLEPDEFIPVFLSLPPTTPLRAVEDVAACMERLAEGDVDIVVAGCESSRNPCFNMVSLDESNRARLAIRPEKSFARRQDAPAYYDLTTTAFVARPEYILASQALFDGRVGMVRVPRERAVDIDDELDLRFAQFLLTGTDGTR